MPLPDRLLNSACEWAVSCPRRLAVFIAITCASPFLIDAVMS